MKILKKLSPFVFPAFIVIMLTAVLSLLGYAQYRLSLLPVDANDQQAIRFTVRAGDGADKTASELAKQKLIKSEHAFLWFITTHGLRTKLQAGDYALKKSFDVPEIADVIAGGRVDTKRLTVPEGMTLAKIRALAEQKGIKATEFDAALGGSHGKDFLVGRPEGIGLEGYLFPDTYSINPSTTAATLVQQMVDNFDLKVTVPLRSAFTAHGLTLHQGITLSSIVESEVSGTEDRRIVAGIFYNRLRLGMPLESDVTVHYAANLLGVGFSTGLNSPYNTYRVKGLPPAPICNPGLDAISAVASPTQTDYLYFLAGNDGKTYYAHTFAEHESNIKQHLR